MNRIAQRIVEQKIIQPGSTLVVAVSGGADSLCLLHVLWTLRKLLHLQLHVAHLNHMLRGNESTADAEFVQTTAQAWDVPVSIETADVAAFAAQHRLNLHDAARRVRYAWLAQLANSIGAHAIVVAHTANDQAETVLMHLLRGAGTDGLSGMKAVEYSDTAQQHESGPTVLPHYHFAALSLIRPLLFATRAEIEAYCAEHNLSPRQDQTNFDTIYTRNRIRHELLPLLQTYNPRIIEALGRTAAISADAEAVMQSALDVVWPNLVHFHPNGITFDGMAWQTLHEALQRAAMRRAYSLLGGKATLAWEHIEQARELIGAAVGKRMPFPDGMWLETGYNGAWTLGAVVQNGPQLMKSPTEIPVPGQIELADGWAIESGIGNRFHANNQWCITFDADALEPPLLARARQAGDRMRPVGGRGSRSIQNMFVDAKIPRALRDQWPIIADTQQIVWLPGVRAAEGCVATAQTKHAIWIRIVAPERI